LLKTDASGATLWTRTYGGENSDGSWCIHETSEGGYIIAGITESFGAGNYDVWLLKTDEEGDIVWTRTYGGSLLGGGKSVQQTSDGGYIIVGHTYSFASPDRWWSIYFIKTDSLGEAEWTKVYELGMDECGGNSVQQLSDGSYIIIGSFNYPWFPFLMKTDSLGNMLWYRYYDVGHHARALDGHETSDHGFIIIARWWLMDSRQYHGALIKTDMNGNELWTKLYDTYIRSGQQTTDGGYIVAGAYGSAWLMKTDSLGDSLWAKIYDTVPGVISMQQTSDEGYILSGNISVSGHGSDIYLLKTDVNGDMLWTKVYGGIDNDYSSRVRQTTDSGYIIAGYTEFWPYGAEVYLVKTGPDVGVEEFELTQNIFTHLKISPNPFRNNVNISYSIGQGVLSPRDENPRLLDGTKGIDLKIYNAMGCLVKRFVLPP
ncbi:MAG: hypothetical protein JSV97_13145, partial [candidate division WOR-3 bacterium]